MFMFGNCVLFCINFLKMACDGLSEVLSTFEKSVENLGEFSEAVQSDTQNVFKSIAKTFSDSLQQKSCSEEISCQNLPPLIIENFVDEQIWQQLELRNAPITAYLHKYLKTFDSFTFGVKNSRSQECNISQTTDVDMSSEEGSDYSFEESDDDDDSKRKNFDERSETESQQTLKEHRKFNPSLSVVDDKFFRVSQLEEFLKLSDLKEERGQDDVGSDESEIDLFADIPSGDEATDDDDCGRESTKKQKSSREVMYKDFFDPPEGDNEFVANQESDIHSNIKDFENRDWHLSKEKTVRFSQDIKADKKLQLLDDSDNDSIPNENPGYEKSSSNSTFERFQEKEHKQMQKLQESSLKEKPWQFTGEIVCGIRPQDSLLPENIEFTSNLRPDFLSTDEVSRRIDNIIMKAMENQAWCDVEVKVRPVDVLKYKYTEPLNQAQSEKSLAQVYEEEYNKMKMGNEDEEEKEDPRHTEIRKLMDSVALTLSNLFSHTPRPPMPEIKVVSNMPAITLEEVAPVGVSDAALLAPEEIKSTSGLPVGKSERSETDKKRERRKKKKLQKIRKIEKEERDRKKAAVSKKAANKFAKQQALKKLSQQKNVTIVQDKKRQRKS